MIATWHYIRHVNSICKKKRHVNSMSRYGRDQRHWFQILEDKNLRIFFTNIKTKTTHFMELDQNIFNFLILNIMI